MILNRLIHGLENNVYDKLMGNKEAPETNESSVDMFDDGTTGHGDCPEILYKATIIIQERGDQIVHEAMNNIDEAIKNKDMDRTEFLVKLLYGNTKQSYIEIEGMPLITNIVDIDYASSLVVQAIGKGQVSIEDGKAYMDVLEKKRKIIETTDIEMRVRELEGNAMRRTILHEDVNDE